MLADENLVSADENFVNRASPYSPSTLTLAEPDCSEMPTPTSSSAEPRSKASRRGSPRGVRSGGGHEREPTRDSLTVADDGTSEAATERGPEFLSRNRGWSA